MSSEAHRPSRSRLLSQWERSRMEVAALMKVTLETQAQLSTLLSLQDQQYEELTGEEPPAFRLPRTG